jgi:hypothetical protein
MVDSFMFETNPKYDAPPHIKVQRAKVVILPSGQKLISEELRSLHRRLLRE